MVDSMAINKLQARDRLVVDTDAWMKDPDDSDFAPRLSVEGDDIIITSATDGSILAKAELDWHMIEMAERDRTAELKVKFLVNGMHGRLDIINPIIADGKAKKLAASSWKTILPIEFKD